ncbi:MAG: protein kinase [Acidobacteria bacterium]|nr:protein kinase [Acidobacteriota bacterium]
MIGRTISHYRIEAELGRGGMGVVYRAHDELLRRPVALKLLADQIESRAERRARILAEARAASALNHPGITTIYEVGEEGEHLFIVMELLAGRSWRALTAEGPMEPKMLARLGAQAAEALAAAHAKGIVHGDVKPENIFMQPDGRVKLLDFGIARQTAAETVTLSRALPDETAAPDAKIVGTLAYMPPEQLRGEDTDGRADLFSLGVVLYELAAGHRPFPGPTAPALMSQILNESPPPLHSGTAAVPGELARIVHKLLEKQPGSRYQSAHELQVDLANLGRDLELGALLPAAVAGKRAAAVLPFKLLTPNLEDEYLSVALADAVINELSASGELLVRPTSTVMRYGKQATDPLVAARELNVQVVVDGSIQRLGPRLRVHVQAWDARDGVSLLSAKHEADLADLFNLQDKIAGAVARTLGAKPAEQTTTAVPPTKNAQAYELFLRASERLARLNRWDMRSAIEMLENAVQHDPRFADAWARLAEACIQMAVTFEPGPQWFRKADQAIRRALAADPDNAEAICARGQILWSPVKRFQNRAALRAHAQALRVNPGCYQARAQQGLILLHVGLMEEGKEQFMSVLAANPDDTRTVVFIGQAAAWRGDYEEANRYMSQALSMDPGSIWANLFMPPVAIYRGELERAAQMIQAAAKVLPGEPTVASLEGLLWAKRGEKRKAERSLERALRGGKPVLHTHHLWHNVAGSYAMLGKPAQAIAWLRKAAGFGLPNYPLFRDDPHLQPLHDHPQFLRLMAGLKKEWNGYRREFGHGSESSP